MTPDNPAFQNLVDDVKVIKDALVGDPLTGRVGIVPQHNQMMEDVYGKNPHGNEIESKKNTLLLRVSKLEDKHKMIKWVVTGMLALGLAIKFGISALIDKIWSK